MADPNLILARRYFIEIMNQANWKTLNEILAPDFYFTLPTHPEPFRGPDGFKGLVSMLHDAFPDFYILPQEMVSSGDTVVTRWRGGGTHTGGPVLTTEGNLPASGRKFEIDGMTWQRMAGGKIVESLGNEDTVGMLTQLGVLPAQGPPPPTTPEQNLALVGRYFNEVMNQGKYEVADEIMAPALVLRIATLPDPVLGVEGLKAFVKSVRTGFPDIKFTIERQCAAEQKAAARWTIAGTHTGPFLGFPASGNKVKDQGVDIFRFSGGKIAEITINENDMGLLQQMGVIPSAHKKA